MLATNALTGFIPTQIGDPTNRKLLHLHGNQTTGTISTKNGSTNQLTEFSLHDNNITGPIPLQIGKLTDIQLLYLEGNRLMTPYSGESFRMRD